MRYDLKRPCKNCPFSPAETRIRFATLERAEEIEESAYRRGFPCHLSAVDTSDDDEDGGFVAGENTQLCMGAAMMYVASGTGPWPGIDNDEDIADAISQNADWNAPHYEGEQEFLDGAVQERNGR